VNFIWALFIFIVLEVRAQLPEAPPRLLIVSEIYLTGTSWDDLGLEREESFAEPISVAIQHWASENLASLGPVGVCRESCLNEFVEWENSHVSKSDFKDKLWLRVVIDLKKSQDHFSWSGRIVLKENENKVQLCNSSIAFEEVKLSNPSQKELNSALATTIYQSALKVLNQEKGRLQAAKRLHSNKNLKVSKYKHLIEVLDLIDDLKTRGSGLGLKCDLEAFDLAGANIACAYQGEEKRFTDLLSQANRLKSKSSLKVDFE